MEIGNKKKKDEFGIEKGPFMGERREPTFSMPKRENAGSGTGAMSRSLTPPSLGTGMESGSAPKKKEAAVPEGRVRVANTPYAAGRDDWKAPAVPYAAGPQAGKPKGQYERGPAYQRPSWLEKLTSTTPGLGGEETSSWEKRQQRTNRGTREVVKAPKYEAGTAEPTEKQGKGSFQRYVRQLTPEEKWQGYLSLMGQPDFKEKSGYQSTYNGGEKFSYIAGMYTDTGFDDILYDYINGDEIARGRISLAPGVRTYEEVSQDAVKLFNYIYSTKGPEEAYNFMDLAAQKQYSGIEAMALGAMNGMGLASASATLGKGISALTGDKEANRRNKEWFEQFNQDTAVAREQHPAAYGTGAVGGNVALAVTLGNGLHALAGGLATGVQIGRGTVQVVLPKVVEGTVNGSLAFLGKTAIQNAGAAATGRMSGKEYLQSIGTAGVQGMAGGLAGGLASSGLEKVLRESGMMTPFMEFLKQSAAGFAAASANMGTGYVLSEEKPSEEQIAMDLTTAFLFSVIQGGISAYRTTNATKAYMEKQYEHMVTDYAKMSREWETLTAEERTEYARLIQGYTREVRAGLNDGYLAGQQKFVNSMNRTLDTFDKAMGAYIRAAGTEGGALAPVGSSGGSELALQLQKSISEGFGAEGAVPAKPGEQDGPPVAYAGTGGPELVDDATAGRLLRDPSCVKFLTKRGGLELTKDMPEAEKRAAVKEAVKRAAQGSGTAAEGLPETQDIATLNSMGAVNDTARVESTEEHEWKAASKISEGELGDIFRKTVKKFASDKKMIEFEKLPQELREDFLSGLNFATPEVKDALINTYRKTNYIIQEGRHSHYEYRRGRNIIALGENATASTIAHELFHQIDKRHEISKRLHYGLAQDHKELNVVSGGDIKGYLMKKYPEAFRMSRRGTLVMCSQYRGIADILNGLSEGQVLYGYGHKTEYWKRKGALEAEAWAQLGRILYENDPQVLKMFADIFPNLFRDGTMALRGDS